MEQLIQYPETFGNLSPRQYIAAMAMQGILSAAATDPDILGDAKIGEYQRINIAKEATLMADVLLGVLDKTEPK